MALKQSWIRAFTVAGVLGYFALATYFDRAHVDLSPPGKVVISLNNPFFNESGFAHRVSNLRQGAATLLGKIQADDPTNPRDTSSPIQLYEGQTPLGPSHSTFRAISKTGGGHFAHWSGRGIFFSSSDNTDPNKNGRRYWAVVP